MHVISLNNVLDNVKNANSHTKLAKQAQANGGTGNLKKLVIKVTIFRFKKESKLLLIIVYFVKIFLFN